MTDPGGKRRQSAEDRLRAVACPTCGKQAPYAESNRWRPFCSERCRLADLGAWASESYRIPANKILVNADPVNQISTQDVC